MSSGDARSSASPIAKSAAGTTPSASQGAPLISLSVIDAPAQRLYAVSAFLLLQAYKILLLLLTISGSDGSIQDAYREGPLAVLGAITNSATEPKDGLLALPQAALIDFVAIFGLYKLRIPRLTFPVAQWVVIFAVLTAVNYTIVTKAGWVGTLLGLALRGLGLLIPGMGTTIQKQLGISEQWVKVPNLIAPKSRILGQYTVHILPHSTAQVSPSWVHSTSGPACKCIGPLTQSVTVPVTFNNTHPHWLQYTLIPLVDGQEAQTFNITIQENELRSIDAKGGHERQLTAEEEEELDMEELDEIGGRSLVEQDVDSNGQTPWRSRRRERGDRIPLRRRLRNQPTQLVYDLKVSGIGRLRLERVIDKNRLDAMINRDQDVVIVECPSATFSTEAEPFDFSKRFGKLSMKSQRDLPSRHVCAASEVDLHFDVRGVGPLEVSYAEVKASHRFPNKRDTQHRVISHILPATQGNNLTEWAQAQQMTLPLSVQARFAGLYELQLESVKDACGNQVKLNALSQSVPIHQKQQVSVHARPKAHLAGCDARKPVILLEGQPPRKLAVRVDDVDEDWTATVRYDPEEIPDGKTTHFSLSGTGSQREAIFEVAQPGHYTIETVNSTHCSGIATSPWVCTGFKIAKPTASITLDTIDDQCAGAVGIKAKADLVGTPPFVLGYEVRHNGAVKRRQWVADRSRAEFDFPLEKEGTVEYSIVSITDNYYKDPIPLPGPTLKQTIHPLASAAFAGSHGRSPSDVLVVRSCSGNSVQAEVDVEGVAPFDLFYETRSSSGVQAHSVSGLSSGRHTLDVELPEALATNGGKMLVTLTKIRDSRGCEKDLTTTDLRVDIKREKPTVAFTPFRKEDRRAHILEGKEGKLPITLTGEGPWTLIYTMDGKEIQTVVNKPDAELTIDTPGEYRLVSVKDSACPGHVVTSQDDFLVTTTKRPSVAFVADEGALQKNGSLHRAQVCRGTRDEVALRVQGQFPVSISYEHRAPSWQGHQNGLTHDTFSAAQDYTYLQLHTEEPGWHRYSLTGIGDSLYDLKAGSYGTLEQMVLPRPKASFKASEVPAFCLHDTFDRSNKAPVLQLSGEPPFTVEVDVQSPTAAIKTYTLDNIRSHQQALDLAGEGFAFDATGRWKAEIKSVIDGHGCRTDYASRAGPEVHGTAIMEVMETAGIASVGSREDYCIGESVDFTLQGTPPWTVTYAFNGKNSTATVRSSDFSRVAEKTGVLEIKSVAHRQNKCRLEVTNPEEKGLRKQIHDLPSVKIREGSHFIQDLLEGSQAEIIFSFSGEPPFSFTYQQTQPIDMFTTPRVLETQTITGVLEHQYSLHTSEEGTWAVTWLQDRYCAVSIDGSSRRSLGKSRLAITAP